MFKLGIPANKVIFTLDKIDELKVLSHDLSVLVEVGDHRVSLLFFLWLTGIGIPMLELDQIRHK